MEANGAIPVVARIEIIMTADGNVACKMNCPSHLVMLGMLESAKLSTDFNIRQKATESKVHLPPPGLQVPRA